MSQAGTFTPSTLPPGTIVETLTGNTGGPVGPDLLNNIDVVGDGTTITVAGNPGTNTLTISALSSGGATSFPTDSGIATPAAGVLNIITNNALSRAGSTVLFSGSGNTVLLEVTDPARFNTIIGRGSGNLTITGLDNVIVGSTGGFSLTDGSENVVLGAGSLPFLTTGDFNSIIGSGSAANYTGDESSNILIGYNVDGINTESNTLRIGSATGVSSGNLSRAFICGIDGVDVGSVATVVTENADQLGTAVITAGTGITVTPGANTITIAATGGSGTTSFDTDSGTATPAAGVINIVAGTATTHTGSTVSFSGSGNTVTFNVTDMVSSSQVMGLSSGSAALTGFGNVGFGPDQFNNLTTGELNTAIGISAGDDLQTGIGNTLLGAITGSAYIGAESYNICIGYGTVGAIGESHVLRLGLGTGNTLVGDINKTIICGIDGRNVGSVATVVTEASNQLGTAVITAGSGISVTPGANTITIATSGTFTFTYTNVSTTPYVVLTTDNFISVDASGGARTIQLPNAATLGKSFVIKDRTGSAATNNITVTTVGGAVNIDAATTFVMNTAYEAITVIGNGSTYEVF